MIPRDVHMDHVIYIFTYLKTHHKSRLVLDLSYPNIDMDDFKCQNGKKFDGDVEESIPLNVPKVIGSEFIVRAFVNADLADDSQTKRLRSELIVMLNKAP